MAILCDTHKQILSNLRDLHNRGVISAETFAVASARTTSECEYAYHEGADGNYRLRTP